MIIRCRNSMNIRITRRTSYLLYIIDKSAGRCHMIYPVNVADIHTHTECLCSYNHTLLSFLELLYNCCFLFLILLAIVRSYQTPISRLHPRLQTHIDATRKRIIKNRLIPVEEIIYTTRHYTLLGFIVRFAFFYFHLPDIESDIPAFHRTCIEHTRLHLQRTNRFEHHIVASLRVPDSSSRQCKKRKRIAQTLLQTLQITSQEPIIHPELFTPSSHCMSLIHYNQTNTTLTCEVLDII